MVVSTFQGCPSDVKAFMDPAVAEKEARRLRHELGVRKGHEGDSENAVEVREVKVAL